MIRERSLQLLAHLYQFSTDGKTGDGKRLILVSFSVSLRIIQKSTWSISQVKSA